MALKTLGPQKAAQLDADLMSEAGGFSIDQLMELAGLSVSQAVYKVHPPSKGKNIFIACGPGNNGGDGLVCARHLHHYGYKPTIYYPKPTSKPIYTGLVKQLHNLHIPFTSDPSSSLSTTNLIIDSLFGFSFHPPVRSPFDTLISTFETTTIPILSVDIPSSWDVESGPPKEGEVGARFMPRYLVSLTAPKPCVSFFRDDGQDGRDGKRHFVGGRFLPEDVAERYGLDLPAFQGVEQIVEVDVGVSVEKL